MNTSYTDHALYEDIRKSLDMPNSFWDIKDETTELRLKAIAALSVDIISCKRNYAYVNFGNSSTPSIGESVKKDLEDQLQSFIEKTISTIFALDKDYLAYMLYLTANAPNNNTDEKFVMNYLLVAKKLAILYYDYRWLYAFFRNKKCFLPNETLTLTDHLVKNDLFEEAKKQLKFLNTLDDKAHEISTMKI